MVQQMNQIGLQAITNHIAVINCQIDYQPSWRCDIYQQIDQNSLLFIKRPPNSDATTHKILISCSVHFILPRRALIIDKH